MTADLVPDCKYLQTVVEGTHLRIALTPPHDFRTGPHGGKRLPYSRTLFRSFVRDNDGELLSDGTAKLAHTHASVKAARRLDRRLIQIFDSPVSAKTVRLVLGISAVELSRWHRDGRLLAHSRQHVGSRKSGFSVPVFPADLIVSLEKDADIVAKWRAHDHSERGKRVIGSGRSPG